MAGTKIMMAALGFCTFFFCSRYENEEELSWQGSSAGDG